METLCSQIEVLRPEWLAGLLLLPLLARFGRRKLTGFSRRRHLATLCCRGLIVAALVLALCGIQAVKSSAGKLVVLAIDRSSSISEQSQQDVEAFLDRAEEASSGGEVALLPFAEEPGTLNYDRSAALADTSPNGTDLAAAIRVVGALIPKTVAPHVVLLSDGNATQGDALEAARTAGMPISVQPLESRCDPEIYVSAVQGKGQIQIGEPFTVEVTLHSSGDSEGKVQIFLEELLADEQVVRVSAGENRVRFVQSLSRPGVVTYTVRIDGFQDTIRENNLAGLPVFVTARPRVLLVEKEPRLGLRLSRALENDQIDVVSRRPEQMPATAADLAGYELVALSNVPAEAISSRMQALRTYVRDFGGGLIAIGGDQAFTPGGYRKTVLEEVLPVWCVAEKEVQKPTLAMVLVIDRSGSMKGEAIELAKEATRAAVRILGPRDQVGVMAFEDNSHWITPIGPCADRQRVLGQIDTIVAGGGTNLYWALDKAYLALDEAFAELKHIIVLTDGASHPGDFETLVTEIADSGITVSTVAVGKEALAELLKEMAGIGRGHYYYCNDAAAVPEIFARETVAASKVGVVERPFFAQTPDPGQTFAKLDLETAPSLLGYVQTRAKPTSRVVLASEQGDPLLVWWRYGLGVSVAFTSDVHSRWAAAWHRWPGFDGFWSTLVRRAMRKDQAEDFIFQVENLRGQATVTLEAIDPDGRFLNGAEATLNMVDPAGNSHSMPVGQTAPGRYTAHFPTVEPGTYYIELRAEHGDRLVYLGRRGLVVGFPDELRTRPADHDLLREIAAVSGGTYAPELSDVFAPVPATTPSAVPLWPGFLAAAVVLLVIDLTIRRRFRPGHGLRG